MSAKTILVPLAKGFEEAEFIGITDVLRRASEIDNNLNIITASLKKNTLVKGVHNIYIQADCVLSEIDSNTLYSLSGIALAGGLEGMNNLKNNQTIIDLIRHLYKHNKLVAAICASPIVLDKAGILDNKDFTCYPSCEAGLKGNFISKAVVTSDNIITGAGPAVGMMFGLEIVKYLCGEDVYTRLHKSLLMPLVKNA